MEPHYLSLGIGLSYNTLGQRTLPFSGCPAAVRMAILPPARMAMVVGTAPATPPGASAKAPGCSVPRPGALFVMVMAVISSFETIPSRPCA
jgi:hypothetical protein